MDTKKRQLSSVVRGMKFMARGQLSEEQKQIEQKQIQRVESAQWTVHSAIIENATPPTTFNGNLKIEQGIVGLDIGIVPYRLSFQSFNKSIEDIQKSHALKEIQDVTEMEMAEQSFKRPQQGFAEQEKTLNTLTKELNSTLFSSRKRRKMKK